MPTTLPPWLRTTGIVVGLLIIATQAAGHFLFGRWNFFLIVLGAVMVGILSPDKLERFLPAPEPPAPPPGALPPTPPAVVVDYEQVEGEPAEPPP